MKISRVAVKKKKFLKRKKKKEKTVQYNAHFNIFYLTKHHALLISVNF